jgi:hypothetical protein
VSDNKAARKPESLTRKRDRLLKMLYDIDDDSMKHHSKTIKRRLPRAGQNMVEAVKSEKWNKKFLPYHF